MKIAYEYHAATYNGIKGFFASRRIDGVFSGRRFGRTKATARLAFESE